VTKSGATGQTTQAKSGGSAHALPQGLLNNPCTVSLRAEKARRQGGTSQRGNLAKVCAVRIEIATAAKGGLAMTGKVGSGLAITVW
jgi:hypothetical protein